MAGSSPPTKQLIVIAAGTNLGRYEIRSKIGEGGMDFKKEKAKRMQNASLKLSEVLDVAVQTSSALSAAHAAGIIHRDIKPENIMRRHDGIVKVLNVDTSKARKAYQDFFALWKDADTDLPILIEAKKEYEKLR